MGVRILINYVDVFVYFGNKWIATYQKIGSVIKIYLCIKIVKQIQPK